MAEVAVQIMGELASILFNFVDHPALAFLVATVFIMAGSAKWKHVSPRRGNVDAIVVLIAGLAWAAYGMYEVHRRGLPSAVEEWRVDLVVIWPTLLIITVAGAACAFGRKRAKHGPE